MTSTSRPQGRCATVSMTYGAILEEALARKAVQDAGFTLESIELITVQETN